MPPLFYRTIRAFFLRKVRLCYDSARIMPGLRAAEGEPGAELDPWPTEGLTDPMPRVGIVPFVIESPMTAGTRSSAMPSS